MWNKGLIGTSAGRVQSVALKYISDREKEVKSFKSEEYWDILSTFKEKFDAHWSKSLPPNTRISLGSINRKNVDGTTNYVLISYKDFKTKFNFKPTNEISQKEYGQAVKELRTYTTGHTRILLGKW
jgi:DNA topoisomerase IA